MTACPPHTEKNAKTLTRGDLSITYSCKRSNIGKWPHKFRPTWKILLHEGLTVSEFNPGSPIVYTANTCFSHNNISLLTPIWLILFNKYCVWTVDAFNAPKID